jgi:putative transposase
LKDIRAAMPEYASIHSHVLQLVLARLDKTYQALFRRVQAGEKAGFPRYQARTCYHSFSYKANGNGARLDNGFLLLSKVGRSAVRWSCRWTGHGRPSRLAKRQAVGMSVSLALMCPSSPYPSQV